MSPFFVVFLTTLVCICAGSSLISVVWVLRSPKQLEPGHLDGIYAAIKAWEGRIGAVDAVLDSHNARIKTLLAQVNGMKSGMKRRSVDEALIEALRGTTGQMGAPQPVSMENGEN